jgi:Na+/H+-dicarboxylate symporter
MVEEQANGPWYFKLHWQVLIALILGILAGIWLTRFAIAIGFLGDLFLRLLKVNLIKPGTRLNIAAASDLPEGFSTAGQCFSEFLLRLVPDTVVSAMANGGVLPVITFAILFGLFLTRLDSPASRSVKQVVDGTLEVIQLLTSAVMRLAIATIIAVDRVLDMMRTATNVWSDLVGTAVITRLEGRAP